MSLRLQFLALSVAAAVAVPALQAQTVAAPYIGYTSYADGTPVVGVTAQVGAAIIGPLSIAFQPAVEFSPEWGRVLQADGNFVVGLDAPGVAPYVGVGAGVALGDSGAGGDRLGVNGLLGVRLQNVVGVRPFVQSRFTYDGGSPRMTIQGGAAVSF